MSSSAPVVTDRTRVLATSPTLPILRLHAASGMSTPLFAILCFAGMALLILLPVAIQFPGSDAFRDILSGALFFACSVGVIAACTSPVFVGARNDLANLKEVLELSAEDHEILSATVTRCTTRDIRVASLFGLVAGLSHSYLLGAYGLPGPYAATQVIATTVLWLLMNWTVPFIVRNAVLFAKLGRQANPDLLRPSRQAGFGAAALRPALFIIAVLCAYPLLLIDGDRLDGPALIGVVASIISLPIIFTLPLRGIRERIREKRQATLAQLDERLDKTTSGDIAGASAGDLFELDAVLDMRERVAQAPAWPLDLAGVRRILLYIVLPPFTWAAAAVVEMLMDNVV